MAKLEGVKTVDMVGGEITKISYEGAEYERVYGEAKSGDIGVVKSNKIMNMSKGDFFNVVKGGKYYDNSGDLRDANYGALRREYDIFRKTFDQSTPTLAKVSEKVDAIEKRVDALEGDKQVETPAKSITHEGVEYTLVDRKAQPGDVIVPTMNRNSYFTNGEPYGPVSDALEVKNNDGDHLGVYNSDFRRTESNVLVYEPDKAALKIGDYVIFTVDFYEHKSGKVSVIREIDSGDFEYTYGLVTPSGIRDGWANVGVIRKATDEEVTEVLRPNEGDIVVITGVSHRESKFCVNEIGDIGVVVGYGPTFKTSVRVSVPGRKQTSNFTHYTDMRLATPAEINRYDEAVAAENAPKFEVGEYARVKLNVHEHRKGDIVKITRIKTNAFDYQVDRIGKNDYGFINVKNLEKLEGKDAERIVQFAKAGRKLNEFKKGDIVRADWTTKSESGGLFEVESDRPIGTIDGGNYGLNDGGVTLGEHLTLIAPVESRVDVN